MYKDSKCMCRTIVLHVLNKSLVWRHFYCHCHRGLLKLPNITEIGPLEQFQLRAITRIPNQLFTNWTTQHISN